MKESGPGKAKPPDFDLRGLQELRVQSSTRILRFPCPSVKAGGLPYPPQHFSDRVARTPRAGTTWRERLATPAWASLAIHGQ